jgi:hypothetical protein
MNEFWTLITGGLSLQWYLAAFVFALMGLFLRWYIKTMKGVKTNPDTPSKFSWAYWWANNGSRTLVSIFATAIIVFLCLRFSFEWFTLAPSMILAVTIGICFDWFFQFIVNLSQKKPVTEKPA